jgi:membrane-associated phospholipid phosphatase
VTDGAPRLRDRVEIRLGLAFWAVAGITAVLSGAAGIYLQYALPLLLVTGAWPFVRHRRWAGVVLDWAPFPIVVLTYSMLHAVVPLCWSAVIDDALVEADAAVLGDHVGAVMESWISRPLTVVMAIAYTSYYFLPTSLGLILYRRHRTAFRELMMGETGALFIGYLGYLFLPAIGPHAHVPAAFTVPLEGDFIGAIIHGINENAGHYPRDAFPSLHTANAVTVLLVLVRHERRLLPVYAPFVLGLIASTMYLRFHYAVDVVAGIALAVVWQLAVVRLVARESAAEGWPLQSPS